MWLPFVKIFLAVFWGAVVVVFGFILLVDPYDGGRFGVNWRAGVLDENPRTASTSRGRDPSFNSVIIGNSHGQLLDPARLSTPGQRQFVQLTVPGTGPREQLTLLDWFARHHPRIGAIVLAADATWCTQDASLPLTNAFPFWLYTGNSFAYALDALRSSTLDRAWRRILLGVGMRQRSAPAGYWDYETGQAWTFNQPVPDGVSPASGMREPQRPFPAIDRLNAIFSGLTDVRYVVVFPPVFVTSLPAAGSAEAERMAECKGAFARIVADRGDLLDFFVDGERARDPRNFMDASHYRSGVAREVEEQIAAALARPRP